MGKKLGLDAKLYRNTGTYGSPTWTEYKNVKDLGLNLTKAEADATTRGYGGWEALVSTLKKGALSFESVYDTADTGFVALLDSFLNNTAVEFAIADGPILTAGTKYIRASMEVFGFNKTENLTDVQRVAFDIKPTYADNAPALVTVS